MIVMSDQSLTTGTKMGTIGGTLTIIIANITTADMLKTIVLAVLGSIVSFGMSMLMRKVVKWWKGLP